MLIERAVTPETEQDKHLWSWIRAMGWNIQAGQYRSNGRCQYVASITNGTEEVTVAASSLFECLNLLRHYIDDLWMRALYGMG